MTNTQNQLEDARNAVRNVLPHQQSAYCNIMGLRSLYAAQAEKFACMLSSHHEPEPLALGRCLSYIYSSIRESTDFINVSVALEVAEKNPGVQDALTVLEPLVANVRRLEAQLAAEAQAAGIRAAEREAAIAAATEKALAEVAAQFSEPSPPAPAEAPQLIRGRQKLDPVPA